MRMNRRIGTAAVLAVLVSGCTDGIKRAEQIPAQSLPTLQTTIKDRQDWIQDLDYLAFYQIGEEIYFKVDPKYSTAIHNIDYEFQTVYQQADLADVYRCRLNTELYESENMIGIQYTIPQETQSERALSEKGPILSSFDRKPYGTKQITLPIESRPKVMCRTSEQLYYLAMHGYCPDPEEPSPAYEIYQCAEETLKRILSDSDSDFERVKAIYDFLTSEIYYDEAAARTSKINEAQARAYLLEGVFLDRMAVCDGKAKAYALLLNMAGIPCVRTTGRGDQGDHAWNYVQLDGKWYLSCTTYGQTKIDSLGIRLANYGTLLEGASYQASSVWGYEPEKYPAIAGVLEMEGAPVYQWMSSDRLSLEVRNPAGFRELIRQVDETCVTACKAEFSYIGEQSDLFETQAEECLPEGWIMTKLKKEGAHIYLLICPDKK